MGSRSPTVKATAHLRAGIQFLIEQGLCDAPSFPKNLWLGTNPCLSHWEKFVKSMNLPVDLALSENKELLTGAINAARRVALIFSDMPTCDRVQLCFNLSECAQWGNWIKHAWSDCSLLSADVTIDYVDLGRGHIPDTVEQRIGSSMVRRRPNRNFLAITTHIRNGALIVAIPAEKGFAASVLQQIRHTLSKSHR